MEHLWYQLLVGLLLLLTVPRRGLAGGGVRERGAGDGEGGLGNLVGQRGGGCVMSWWGGEGTREEARG